METILEVVDGERDGDALVERVEGRGLRIEVEVEGFGPEAAGRARPASKERESESETARPTTVGLESGSVVLQTMPNVEAVTTSPLRSSSLS